MGFPVFAWGANAGLDGVLKTNRTVIAAQSTPTAIKTVSGKLYGISAINDSTVSLAAIQYFTSAGSTLGVSTPTFEVFIPAGVSGSVIAKTAVLQMFPGGIEMDGGIHIAGSVAASTGPNVSASTVTVYTLYV